MNEHNQTFFETHNINTDELIYLGSGQFGEAYSIGDGRVLKITTSNSEFDIAKSFIGKNISCIAKIYNCEIVNGQKLIILEELEQPSKIEDMFYTLLNILDEHNLPIQYVHELDYSELELDDELIDFINTIEDINRVYRNLGIEASDIQPDNLGYSKDGNLKAFDLDDKRK